MVKDSQSFHNWKFAMSLQHLKKDFRDEVDLLQADKHQSLPQVDFKTWHQSFLQGGTFVIDRHDQTFSKYSK